MAGRYKIQPRLTSVTANRTIAASETKSVGQYFLNSMDEARFMRVRLRASTRAGGGTVTATLYHAPTAGDTLVTTGLSVVIVSADTDYYITLLSDPTGTVSGQDVLLMPHLEVRVAAVTGNAVISNCDFFGM